LGFEEVDEELLDDELVEVVDEAVLEVEGLGEQDSEAPRIGPDTGSEEGEIDDPGGTLTVNVWVPVAVRTVTTHWSAATGVAATPRTTSEMLAAAHATTSLRLLDAMAYLLPPS
jgi:hypothetical protein